MARQPDDLALDAGLIRKGEARGFHPATATPERPPEQAPIGSLPPMQAAPAVYAPPAPLARQATSSRPRVGEPPIEDTEPPLRAAPPADVPLRFTSFRLPVELDEALRDMMYETRRSKQDLLTGFVQDGVNRWRQQRRRGGGSDRN
jgi:hypothetical protein